MFKKILFGLILTLIFFNVGWADYLGIVNRTQNLPVPFVVLDTMGNPTSLASGDSVYIQVSDPDGAETFRDSMAYNDASIISTAWEDYAGGQIYVYEEAVSTLDGSSTDEGIFTVNYWIQDLTSAALETPGFHTFQMVNSTLESSLDSAGLTMLAANKIIDSLADVLDSLEQYDDWVAPATELAKVIDSLADVLDSLETISTWLQDSLYAVIDSIQIKWANRTGFDPTSDSVIVDGTEFAVLSGAITATTIATEAIGALELAPNCIGAEEFTLGAADKVADEVWDEGVAAHNTPNSFGDSLMSLGDTLIITKAEVINIDAWNPTSDSVNVDGSALAATANAISATTIASNAIGASEIASNAITAAEIAANAITASEIATDAITSAELAASAVQEIVDANWDEDTTGHKTDPNMGYWITQGGTATISDADMGAIGDTIWLKDTTGLLDAGTYGLEATTGAAANISDAAMGAIADSVWDKIFADAINVAGGMGDSLIAKIIDILDTLKLWDTRIDSMEAALADANLAKKIWDTDIDAKLKSLVVSNSGGDAVQFTSTGSDGDGLQLTGEGSGQGLYAYGGATNGSGIKALGRAAGSGFWAWGGSSGSGIYAKGEGTGHGFYVFGGATNADGFKIVGQGTGDDINLAGDNRIRGYIDSVVAVGGVATGTRTMTFYTIDTTDQGNNNADTLANIMLDIVDQTGNSYFKGRTSTSGILPVLCNDNDTFLVYAYALPTYNFLGEGGAGTEIGYDSIFIVNGDTTIDVKGYPISVAAPGAADLCRLYSFVRNHKGDIVTGARMIVQMKGANIEDTCNSTVIVNYETYGNPSDADSGFTYVDVIKSKCLLKRGGVASAVKYKVGIDYGTSVNWIWQGIAPDQSTYGVTRY